MERRKGFTIVELLTVMGVIAVLIGLLVPALALVKDFSKRIQQKAQFHGIDVGVEIFKNEYGSYPDSFDNLGASTPAAVPPLIPDPANYGGAQKLAEAMVGWDLLGYHPKSGFRSDGQNYFPDSGAFVASYQLVYDTTTGLQIGSYYEANGTENIKARQEPLVDLENANAYQMADVYGSTNVGGFNPNNLVLCDVYGKKRPSGEKTGMPVLYYKANVKYTFQDWTDVNTHLDDVYNYEDNEALIDLGTAENNPQLHDIADPAADRFANFEQIVLNKQVLNASGVQQPYRAQTYILISAGKDGIYGTADDIMNFGAETTE